MEVSWFGAKGQEALSVKVANSVGNKHKNNNPKAQGCFSNWNVLAFFFFPCCDSDVLAFLLAA